MYINMKVNKKSFVMLGGVLLLLLFFTLSFTGLRGKEGFGSGDDNSDDEPYSNYANNSNVATSDEYDEYEEYDDDTLPTTPPQKMTKPIQKMTKPIQKMTKPIQKMKSSKESFSNREGFEGALPHLRPENSTSEEKMLDIFSQVEGKLSCGPISSQLHNSRGGLCLNADQHKILQTRGGNATGGDYHQHGF